MTTTALKKQLVKTIEKVNDQELLAAVYSILNNALIKSEGTLNPMSLDAFFARNEQSQSEIAKGKLIQHQDVRKRLMNIK